MLLLDLLDLFLEPELLALGLDVEQLNHLAVLELKEDLGLVYLVLFELRYGLGKSEGLKHGFDVDGRVVLLLFLFFLLPVLILVLHEALSDKLILCHLVLDLTLDDCKVSILVEDIQKLEACDLLISHELQDLLHLLVGIDR